MGKIVKKKWLTDGKEDKFIEELISQGKITKFTQPSYLKQNYSKMFNTHSDQVIRNHLNVLKRSHGLYCKCCVICFCIKFSNVCISVIDSVNGENVEGADCDLDDVGDLSTANDEHLRRQSTLETEYVATPGNSPYIVEKFIGSDSLEHVGVMVTLPGGATSVRFEVNEEGDSAILTYDWPQASHDMQDLFGKKLKEKTMTMDHPLILAFERGLAKKRALIDAIPKPLLLYLYL